MQNVGMVKWSPDKVKECYLNIKLYLGCYFVSVQDLKYITEISLMLVGTGMEIFKYL